MELFGVSSALGLPLKKFLRYSGCWESGTFGSLWAHNFKKWAATDSRSGQSRCALSAWAVGQKDSRGGGICQVRPGEERQGRRHGEPTAFTFRFAYTAARRNHCFWVSVNILLNFQFSWRKYLIFLTSLVNPDSNPLSSCDLYLLPHSLESPLYHTVSVTVLGFRA